MKKMMKRVLAVTMALIMAFNVQTPQVVEAASDTARYAGGYTIEDALTYFQYFTKEDCNLSVHTVGPVAVGGTLKAVGFGNPITIGDAAQTPSYANKLTAAVVPDANTQQQFGGTCTDFYIGEYTMESRNYWLNPWSFTMNADYMDIAGNFANIESESANLVNGSTAAVVNENKVIELDFTKSTNYNITYEQLCQAVDINMIVGSVDDFKTQKCVVNITGVNGQKVVLDGTNDKGAENSEWVNVKLNNTTSEYLKSMSGSKAAGQHNPDGMKLIFNFPDATGEVLNVTLGGHIVAPKATVIPCGGSMEGGVIAKNVTSSDAEPTEADKGIVRRVQAHYYPYNGLKAGAVEGTVTVDNIQITKKYVETVGGSEVAESELPTTTAKFALYSDAACTQIIAG
ncbi:MAG: choice-of-anchor A family protein, partial [Lachnospiraceae bacterium]|nr:choice-of-anchor A family protein [Lachnospiraceae bacterium]